MLAEVNDLHQLKVDNVNDIESTMVFVEIHICVLYHEQIVLVLYLFNC